jgi:hypothetical protein
MSSKPSASPITKGSSEEAILHKRGYILDKLLGEGSYAKVVCYLT